MQNTRKTFFGDRINLIVCGFIAACVILLSLYFIVGYFAYRPYQKYRTAMKEGDGKNAVYYATKIFHQSERDFNKRKEKYGFSDKNRYNECYLDLCYAYELNSEYDLALKRYQLTPQGNALDIARVLYKVGRLSESFEKYCEFYKEQAETYDDLKSYRKTTTEEYLYDRIMCHDIIEDSRKFRPFATFHDFYAFMKKECEKQGGPGQYAKVMELFRDIDSSAESHMARHNE